MGREELSARVSNIKVFARTTPKHKMKIVEAFKDVGEVVGMTGDGGNVSTLMLSSIHS
jgi:Ca2+-transporting ATPase